MDELIQKKPHMHKVVSGLSQ